MITILEELEVRLQTASVQTEEARIEALLALAWHIRFLDPQRGEALSEEAILWAKSNHDPWGLGSGLGTLGACLCFQSRTGEALPLLQQGLNCIQEHQKRSEGKKHWPENLVDAEARCHYGLGLAYWMKSDMTPSQAHYEIAAQLFEANGDLWNLAGCYNNLACVFRDTNNYSAALTYCDQARQLREEIGDGTGLASTLLNIGNIYKDLSDHAKALEFHLHGLHVYEKIDFRIGLCATLGSLAGDYSDLQRHEKAMETGRQALDMAIELGLHIYQVTPLVNIGYSSFRLGRVQEAEENYQHALKLARFLNNSILICDILSKLGDLLHQQNRDQEAQISFRECISHGEASGSIRLLSLAHQGLAKIYQANGDFESALHHHQQYHALHEKVFSEEADKHSKLLFIQMEVEKARQEAEIHRLKTVELAEANTHLAQANARLEALATTDPLTGLANHRAMVAALDLELERCHRYSHPCALLFLDIDHFKTLNDSYGHPVGDAVLREFAALVQSCLRGPDILGRWGGEEFLALLPETDKACAYLLAERVRTAVASRIFEAGGGLHLTCSLGVAPSPVQGADRDALIQAADQAVYAAKRLGRNQVRLVDDPAVTLLAAAAESGREETALSGTVEALASLVAVRDAYTGEHNENVGILAMRLALALGLDASAAHQVGLAARLHDIGKVGVPDAILHKRARLSGQEWKTIRQHPVLGAEVVSHVPGLRPLASLIRSHHERWDGSGYPDGLAGEAIPLGARILAVADAWGAMTTERPYRRAECEAWAREELQRGMGTQFDPVVVQTFFETV